MALKIFLFSGRTIPPPHIFPVKRALFQALFCWVGKSIMRMQIRGEKCKSPLPSHLVSFDFCAFWKSARFSQPLKNLEVERNMVRNWEKRCADFFVLFLSPAHSRPEVHFLFGVDSNLAKTEDHLVPLHSARMSNRPIPMLPF